MDLSEILIIGGGNWGDLWFGSHRLPRLRTFIELAKKDITVIGMPQSMHYNNKVLSLEDAAIWMKNVSKELPKGEAEQKIVLTWRQENSYQQAQTLYPLVDNRYILFW